MYAVLGVLFILISAAVFILTRDIDTIYSVSEEIEEVEQKLEGLDVIEQNNFEAIASKKDETDVPEQTENNDVEPAPIAGDVPQKQSEEAERAQLQAELQTLQQTLDSLVYNDPIPYIEIKKPTGFVNSEPFSLSDLVGEKVILVKFTTFSCYNCQNVYPHVISWHEKYEDDGLAVVAIHTPEFAFEKEIENVRDAMAKEGIEFPVVLDNDYATWRAYGNRFWPRIYVIDINGNIVYDHIGEGAYDITENVIKKLLDERRVTLGQV